jgi:hypothetical protein
VFTRPSASLDHPRQMLRAKTPGQNTNKRSALPWESPRTFPIYTCAALPHHRPSLSLPFQEARAHTSARGTAVCQASKARKLRKKKLDRVMVVPSDAMAALESLPLDIIPMVDMSATAGELARRLVRACAELGFFWAVNHGVPPRAAGRRRVGVLRAAGAREAGGGAAGPAGVRQP